MWEVLGLDDLRNVTMFGIQNLLRTLLGDVGVKTKTPNKCRVFKVCEMSKLVGRTRKDSIQNLWRLDCACGTQTSVRGLEFPELRTGECFFIKKPLVASRPNMVARLH